MFFFTQKLMRHFFYDLNFETYHSKLSHLCILLKNENCKDVDHHGSNDEQRYSVKI